MEKFRPALGGLGVGGAMSINLIFGGVLAARQLLPEINLSPQGRFILWLLVLILVGISVVEAYSLWWRKCSNGQKIGILVPNRRCASITIWGHEEQRYKTFEAFSSKKSYESKSPLEEKMNAWIKKSA